MDQENSSIVRYGDTQCLWIMFDSDVLMKLFKTGDSMSGDDKMVTEVLAAAPMPLAEVPAQSESVEEVLRDEPAINLASDHDEYPEMELDEEEEVYSKETKVEQEIKIKDGEEGKVKIKEGQPSVEVQDLRTKVLLLEELWKTERALREMTEERNILKAQVDRMRVKGNVSSKDVSKKKKDNKRKKNNDSDNNSENSHSKKKQACGKCGKNHSGECMWGKNVCYNCGQEGHLSPNCPKPKKGGCFACGGMGHRVKTCPKKKTDGGSGRKKD